jgi:hypothetical protein
VVDVTEAPSSAASVRSVVAAADRRRRVRQAVRFVARLAPACAAAVLFIALLARVAGWSSLTTIVVWSLFAAILAVYAVVTTRSRATSDVIAAAIDTEASLGGELRSAYWFSSAADADEWTSFHLDQAARRVAAVSWNDVYPPVRAYRAWIATGALTLAALALPAGVPTAPRRAIESQPTAAEALAILDLDSLPPELRDQLLQLLEAVTEGRMTNLEALAAARELTTVAKIDADTQQQILDLIEGTSREEKRPAPSSAPMVAEAKDMTGDVEWARENMLSRLAAEEAQRKEAGEGNGENEPNEGKDAPLTEQSAQGEAGEASEGQTGQKVRTKPTGAAEAAAGMMLKNQNGEVGDPGSAFGGKRGNVRYGTTPASEIAAALKREMVEANMNVDRSNPDREDKRRKTEQSWSTLSYTKAAARSSFDNARTEAPRAVPEARKPLIERYFVREAPAEVQPPPAPAGARD